MTQLFPVEDPTVQTVRNEGVALIAALSNKVPFVTVKNALHKYELVTHDNGVIVVRRDRVVERYKYRGETRTSTSYRFLHAYSDKTVAQVTELIIAAGKGLITEDMAEVARREHKREKAVAAVPAFELNVASVEERTMRRFAERSQVRVFTIYITNGAPKRPGLLNPVINLLVASVVEQQNRLLALDGVDIWYKREDRHPETGAEHGAYHIRVKQSEEAMQFPHYDILADVSAADANVVNYR